MLSRVVPMSPTVCPVSLDMLRRHANIDDTDDDDLLQIYGNLATDLAEKATNRYFLQRMVKWTLTADTRQTVYFSMAVTLQNFFNTYQRPWLHLPNSATVVNSFSVGQWGQSLNTLVLGQDYNVDLSTDPARVEMLTFVEFDPNVDHLEVVYTSGYATTPEQLISTHPALAGAVMMLATRMKENRGDQDSDFWRCGAMSLLAPYVSLQFAGMSDLYNA